jgi:hypothetical protein
MKKLKKAKNLKKKVNKWDDNEKNIWLKKEIKELSLMDLQSYVFIDEIESNLLKVLQEHQILKEN